MFKDTDIVEVYFGKGYAIDGEQEFLGEATFYKGASKLVHDKLEKLNYESGYLKHIPIDEANGCVDFGSHYYFFKLRLKNGKNKQAQHAGGTK